MDDVEKWLRDMAAEYEDGSVEHEFMLGIASRYHNSGLTNGHAIDTLLANRVRLAPTELEKMSLTDQRGWRQCLNFINDVP